jgi:hypothetical protein
MPGHQGGFNKIPNADIRQSWKKYVTRYNAHALSTVLRNLLLFTLATVIVFCDVYVIVIRVDCNFIHELIKVNKSVQCSLSFSSKTFVLFSPN